MLRNVSKSFSELLNKSGLNVGRRKLQNVYIPGRLTGHFYLERNPAKKGPNEQEIRDNASQETIVIIA